MPSPVSPSAPCFEPQTSGGKPSRWRRSLSGEKEAARSKYLDPGILRAQDGPEAAPSAPSPPSETAEERRDVRHVANRPPRGEDTSRLVEERFLGIALARAKSPSHELFAGISSSPQRLRDDRQRWRFPGWHWESLVPRTWVMLNKSPCRAMLKMRATVACFKLPIQAWLLAWLAYMFPAAGPYTMHFPTHVLS